LLTYGELDDVFRLTGLTGAELSERRRGKNIRHLLTGLFRQSVFVRLVGYEDVNEAGRLALDSARWAVVNRGGLDCQDASTTARLVGVVLARLLWCGVTSGARAQQLISSGRQAANLSGRIASTSCIIFSRLNKSGRSDPASREPHEDASLDNPGRPGSA
jgi:hypothetical protein